jgi:hypothetical protein
MRSGPGETTSATLPRITIPPSTPPTPEEIERRRALVAKVWALREEIGPIGISTAELVRQAREEEDGDDW